MGIFGQAAILAVNLFRKETACSPKDAWNKAISRISQSESSRNKGCPRDTFLGICSVGEIPGIPPGNYSNSEKNATYGIDAIRFLRIDPSLKNDLKGLWRKVIEGKNISHNGQMDVVIALWQMNLINRSPIPNHQLQDN